MAYNSNITKYQDGQPAKAAYLNTPLNETEGNFVELEKRGTLLWSSTVSYSPPAVVLGSDNNLYQCESTSTGNEPTTNPSYWKRIEAGNALTLAGQSVGTGASDIPTNLGVVRPLGAFDASTANYPTSPIKGDWYRVSVEGTVSGRDLKVDDKIYYDGTAWQWVPFSTAGGVIWQTITGNKTFTNDDSGTTFYTSANATLTLPAYSGLDETWVVEIVCDDGPYTAHTLTLATTGTDTIRNGATTLNGDAVIMVSAVTGEFVVIQGPGKLGTAAFMDAVGNVDNGSAIIESGSNANGSWTKWADGTMICSGIARKGGTTWKTAGHTINFPQVFVFAPVFVGSSANKDGTGYSILWNIKIVSSSSATVWQIASGITDTGTTINLRWVAYGKWK